MDTFQDSPNAHKLIDCCTCLLLLDTCTWRSRAVFCGPAQYLLNEPVTETSVCWSSHIQPQFLLWPPVTPHWGKTLYASAYTREPNVCVPVFRLTESTRAALLHVCAPDALANAPQPLVADRALVVELGTSPVLVEELRSEVSSVDTKDALAADALDAAMEDAPDAASEDVVNDAPDAITEVSLDAATEVELVDVVNYAPDAATEDALDAATEDAPDAATKDELVDVVNDAPDAVTEVSPDVATEDAPDAATEGALDAATEDEFLDVVNDAFDGASEDALVDVVGDAPNAATEEEHVDVVGDAPNAATEEEHVDVEGDAPDVTTEDELVDDAGDAPGAAETCNPPTFFDPLDFTGDSEAELSESDLHILSKLIVSGGQRSQCASSGDDDVASKPDSVYNTYDMLDMPFSSLGSCSSLIDLPQHRALQQTLAPPPPAGQLPSAPLRFGKRIATPPTNEPQPAPKSLRAHVFDKRVKDCSVQEAAAAVQQVVKKKKRSARARSPDSSDGSNDAAAVEQVVNKKKRSARTRSPGSKDTDLYHPGFVVTDRVWLVQRSQKRLHKRRA